MSAIGATQTDLLPSMCDAYDLLCGDFDEGGEEFVGICAEWQSFATFGGQHLWATSDHSEMAQRLTSAGLIA